MQKLSEKESKTLKEPAGATGTGGLFARATDSKVKALYSENTAERDKLRRYRLKGQPNASFEAKIKLKPNPQIITKYELGNNTKTATRNVVKLVLKEQSGNRNERGN